MKQNCSLYKITMKGLILLRGLTFRDQGAYARRVRVDSYTLKVQKLATESHIKLIQSLKNQGHEIEVAFDTISSPNTNILLEMLEPYANYVSTKSLMDICPHFALFRAVGGLETAFFCNEYDFFLIIRNDMFLKDTFIELFNPENQKVMFLSLQWYQARKTPNGNPRINDCMFFIPKKYLNLRFFFPIGIGYDHHDILDDWLKLIPDLEYDFYIRGYHNSDTATEKHPLYALVNRPEAEEIGSPDLKYPEDF